MEKNKYYDLLKFANSLDKILNKDLSDPLTFVYISEKTPLDYGYLMLKAFAASRLTNEIRNLTSLEINEIQSNVNN